MEKCRSEKCHVLLCQTCVHDRRCVKRNHEDVKHAQCCDIPKYFIPFPCARLACGKCVDINIQQTGYQRSICPSTYVSLRVAKLSTRRRMAREHRGAGSSLVATIWLQTILLESSNSSNFLRKLLKSAENLTVSSEKTRELSSFHHQVQ